MGFAGQVFAARVAVGLAMPSPKAFSQAGATIGGFASKMYNRLNKQGAQAAQKNLKSAQQNLSNAKSQLEKHSKSQSSFIEKSAKTSVARLQGAYKKLGKSVTASAGALKGIKAKLGKTVSTKLFANTSKDLKDAKDYEKMMVNFTKLQKEERKEVMLGLEAYDLKLKMQINTTGKREKLGKTEVTLIKDERAELKIQLDEFQHFEKTRGNDMDAFHKKHKKLSQDEIDANKAVADAQDEVTESMKETTEIQEYLTQGASDFVIELQTGFVEALRESVSVLAAFYYKLSENTQELIEFERELMNANSVFQVTRDELFTTGDVVVQFGQKFGLEMQNGATGLYQLASAGLSASDSLKVLPQTLKLSMAVQGDHNTISKLVTQTLFGFEMEMDQAAIVADKFAYAIQKSLIEYQDLASAVKFALPFFTTTGQSIDQLLGALQILTNRALEAGIAGRGLRQGLAELAESIGDSTARFREYGIEVTDAQGNMLELTEIAANFSKVLSAGVINDTELLTTLIEDLNVRGATAFVHLVQASDEFTQAVKDTEGAGGELDKMVRIQNESIGAQIQILKNNVAMMFLYRDANYEGTQYLNAFHEAMVTAVASLRDMLVVERDGTAQLTEFGLAIQKVAITGVQEMQKILANALPLVNKFIQLGALGVQVFKAYLIPVKLLLKVLDTLGPTFVKFMLTFHILNKLLPISTALNFAYFLVLERNNTATSKQIILASKQTITTKGYTAALMAKLFWQKLSLFMGWAENTEKVTSTALIVTETAAVVGETTARAVNTSGLIVATTALTAHNAAMQFDAAATIRSLFLHAVKVPIQQAEIAGMTQEAFVRKLVAAATLITTDAIANPQALRGNATRTQKAGTHLLSAQALLVESTATNVETVSEVGNTAAVEANSIGVWKRIGAKLTSIATKIQETIVTIAESISEWLNTWATYSNTLAERSNTMAKNEGVIAGIRAWLLSIRSSIAKVMEGVITWAAAGAEWALTAAKGAGLWMQIAYTLAYVGYVVVGFIGVAVTLLLAAAFWLLSVPLLILTSPIWLIVIGIVALTAALVVMGQKINEQIDVMFYFKQMISGIGSLFIWLAKILIWPFVKLGEIIYSVIDEHLFKLILFFKHIVGMIKWVVGEIVEYFQGDSVGSTLSDVLMAPFNAMMGVINWLIGVVWSNENSLYNSMLKLWNWVDTTFGLTEKFNLMKDAAKAAWEWIKDNFTWDSIKGAFAAIGDGIKNLLLMPVRALAAVWDGAIGLISGKSITFGGKYGIPKITVSIPSLDGWKIGPKFESLMAGTAMSSAASAEGTATPENYPTDGVATDPGLVTGGVGRAEGGYLTPMQKGGYIVGEKGPELFRPKQSGQIIPNKDLNTQRVKNMLADAFGMAPRDGAAGNVNRVLNLTVENLEAGSAKMNKTRMGVDTFA